MLTLKQFRQKYKMTQKQLAEFLGTTPTTLSKY
ncbi:MAG: helix-turn-helix transcriptional regulator [Clostridia bacterium]|nr:helix-turn-helix transcriptional regulator [Clostridia bacterium]